jgi:hypothetical protein
MVNKKFRFIQDALLTGVSAEFYNYFAINTPRDEDMNYVQVSSISHVIVIWNVS